MNKVKAIELSFIVKKKNLIMCSIKEKKSIMEEDRKR